MEDGERTCMAWVLKREIILGRMQSIRLQGVQVTEQEADTGTELLFSN